MRSFVYLLVLFIFLLVFGCSSETSRPKEEAALENTNLYLVFNGGPKGGTFNFFAHKMAAIIAENVSWIDVGVRPSDGSAENLRALHKGGVDMGILYAGDGFLGKNGKLPGDAIQYDDVLAVAHLYGAPAQLVVRKDSPIRSVKDLRGKVVAIGNPGSGAALAAERFFRTIGLWGAFDARNLGYAAAAEALVRGEIDGFWVLVGFPNSSVVQAASQGGVRLLDLHEVAYRQGFYEVYPFYARVVIPAGTYAGQDGEGETFQDVAMWCVRKDVEDKVVYQCLKTVFSESGLTAMGTAHKAGQEMSVQKGVLGLSLSLHPGALRFWGEQGIGVPHRLIR